MTSLLQVNAFASEPKAKSMEELSKEIANPLAKIWNLSFQYNYSTIEGDLVDGSEDIQTGLFQPVLPIPLGDTYTFFARPVITVIDGPNAVGITGGTPADPIGHGLDRSTELGDIILPAGIGIVNKIGWSGGLGATLENRDKRTERTGT